MGVKLPWDYDGFELYKDAFDSPRNLRASWRGA
jgi:hypothetical protein